MRSIRLFITFSAVCAGSLGVLHCSAPAAEPDLGILTVTYFKMPLHGLAVVLQTPGGKAYVIDCGPVGKEYNAGRDAIVPLLKEMKINEITELVLSHPHGDHYGSASWLIDNFCVKSLRDSGYDARGMTEDYRALRKQVVKKGGEYHASSATEKLEWDPNLTVEILSPPKEYLSLTADPAKVSEHGLLNTNSLVLRVQHKDVVFLFPGDAYGSGQQYMLKNVKREKLVTNIMCAPHHGFNSSPEFAEITKPEIVIASCLAKYENSVIVSPGDKAKEVYGKVGSKVYVTALDGTVRVISDGKTYKVDTEKK